MYTGIGAKGPYHLELCPLVGFQKIKMCFAQLLLCLWSYFDETYTTLGLSGKEGVVAEWWPRAHNSWSYVP